MESKRTLYILISNHMDPMHRRCFDRTFEFKGDTYVSYADLEELYILTNLDFARKYPDYRFVAESPLVMRKFMERRPDLAGELLRLSRDGRLYISGTGDNIIDSNMVLGESIVRNYLTGLLWVEDHFSQVTRLANRADSFGNSAQLPQILRGCEMNWCTNFSYSGPGGSRYWRGLDGSTVLVGTLPSVGSVGHYRAYGPCPVCRGNKTSDGHLCAACEGTGINRGDAERDWAFHEINKEAFGDFSHGFVHAGGEELLPSYHTAGWVEQLRKQYTVEYALPEAAMPIIKHWLDIVDAASENVSDPHFSICGPDSQEICPAVELNPNNTGCYVTRIKTKQTCRRQEYSLLSAEALSVMARLSGGEYPKEILTKTWQKLLFTMFHDAITGTHVDPAYEELSDIWTEVDRNIVQIRSIALKALTNEHVNRISIINPMGHPVTTVVDVMAAGDAGSLELVSSDGRKAKILELCQADAHTRATILIEQLAPFSSITYEVCSTGLPQTVPVQTAEPVIENHRYRITADDHGLLSVFDKRLDRDILAAGEYRPGEFILEHDEGSPWTTLSPDMTRYPLSPFTKLTGITKGHGYQRLQFEIPKLFSYAEDSVGIRYSVTLWDGLDRIDFNADVDWEDFNHRLRIAMPVPFTGSHAYEIPYGTLHREQYEPRFDKFPQMTRWFAPSGDWPAVNWAGVDSPEISVALLNKGTPSYRIEKSEQGKAGEKGTAILLTVLRSPTFPTYLHEPRAYTMTDWIGMRDAGTHHFDYAVTSYGGPLTGGAYTTNSFAESSVVHDAEQYNCGLLAVPGTVTLPEMPALSSRNVRLSSVKLSDKGDALILRLAEFRGVPGEAQVQLPGYVRSAAKVNLLERQPEPLEIGDRKVRLQLRAFEIATLRLELQVP